MKVICENNFVDFKEFKEAVCVLVWLITVVCMCRQRGLFRVLKAYTQFQPTDGYCQAQGPVAAVLLMNMPAEVKTKNIFLSCRVSGCKIIIRLLVLSVKRG